MTAVESINSIKLINRYSNYNFRVIKKLWLSIIVIIYTFIPLYGQTLNTDKLMWPGPPDEPRIEFIKSIISPKDFGLKKTVWKKIRQKLVGNNDIENYIQPQGIAISNNGCLAIAETDLGRIQIFDVSNNKFKVLYKIGKEKLESPVDVQFDLEGNLYISDSILKKVLVINKKYKLINQYGINGEFKRPTGLAIYHEQRKIYIVDTVQNCIFVFDFDGKMKLKFGQKGNKLGEFNFPTYICIDQQGKVYITDTLNFRVQIFSSTGEPLFTFGQVGQTLGSFAKPKGIAVDSHQNIYVVDSIFGCIQIFNSTGQLLLVIGENGSKNGQFSLPGEIIISPEDHIYIADSFNHRIQVLKYLKR